MTRELWRAVEAQRLAGEAVMLHEARRHIHPDDYAAGPGREALIHSLTRGYTSGANPGPELTIMQFYAQAIYEQAVHQ